VVQVFRSPRPVFCTLKPGKAQGAAETAVNFYVRVGNQSPSMSPTEANSYIAMHWRA
jgi:hypothetical protein